MYKITLTGATGFIGTHLMKYLGSLGYEIDTISKEEFMAEDWARLDNFKLELGSANPQDVYQYGTHPDILIHCAWPKLDLHSTDHLEFAEMSCNLLNECKKRGIRVINLGSSSEYGVKFEPMKEDMICEPINTYGIAKLMVTLYAKKLGFNTLRLFTVVGEGGYSFFDNYKKWDKWEYPKSNRDIININKVCKAVERLIHMEHLYAEIINVASGDKCEYGDGISFLEISTSKWLKSPQTQCEPRLWQADITKMQKLLNI